MRNAHSHRRAPEPSPSTAQLSEAPRCPLQPQGRTCRPCRRRKKSKAPRHWRWRGRFSSPSRHPLAKSTATGTTPGSALRRQGPRPQATGTANATTTGTPVQEHRSTKAWVHRRAGARAQGRSATATGAQGRRDPGAQGRRAAQAHGRKGVAPAPARTAIFFAPRKSIWHISTLAAEADSAELTKTPKCSATRSTTHTGMSRA